MKEVAFYYFNTVLQNDHFGYIICQCGFYCSVSF